MTECERILIFLKTIEMSFDFVNEENSMKGDIIAVLLMGAIGLIFTYLGYMIWIKERIDMIHSYLVEKVSEEDKKAFCKLSGLGVFIIGISILISAVILGATDSVKSFICFVIGFIVGLGMLIAAGMKYNN